MRAAYVAGRFGCNRRIIYRLQSHFRLTGRAKDIPPSGRPPNTTPLEDIYLVTSSRRTHFMTSQVKRTSLHRAYELGMLA